MLMICMPQYSICFLRVRNTLDDPEVQHFVDFQKELDLWIDNKSSSNSKLCTSTDVAQAQWGNRGAARSNDEM